MRKGRNVLFSKEPQRKFISNVHRHGGSCRFHFPLAILADARLTRPTDLCQLHSACHLYSFISYSGFAHVCSRPTSFSERPIIRLPLKRQSRNDPWAMLKTPQRQLSSAASHAAIPARDSPRPKVCEAHEYQQERGLCRKNRKRRFEGKTTNVCDCTTGRMPCGTCFRRNPSTRLAWYPPLPFRYARSTC
jgi:hypothetical protein